MSDWSGSGPSSTSASASGSAATPVNPNRSRAPLPSSTSTIVSLIPRFYDPTAGRILIDGTDIRDYTLQGIRRQIGFVLQDTVLFRGTVRNNIAYGRPDATEDQIIAAAQLANAHEFIVRMPRGYDT